jgi:hypothetical protein
MYAAAPTRPLSRSPHAVAVQTGTLRGSAVSHRVLRRVGREVPNGEASGRADEAFTIYSFYQFLVRSLPRHCVARSCCSAEQLPGRDGAPD